MSRKPFSSKSLTRYCFIPSSFMANPLQAIGDCIYVLISEIYWCQCVEQINPPGCDVSALPGAAVGVIVEQMEGSDGDGRERPVRRETTREGTRGRGRLLRQA